MAPPPQAPRPAVGHGAERRRGLRFRVFFVVLPLALRSGVGFWAALLLACAAAGVSYGVWVWAGRRVGLNF